MCLNSPMLYYTSISEIIVFHCLRTFSSYLCSALFLRESPSTRSFGNEYEMNCNGFSCQDGEYIGEVYTPTTFFY